MAYERQYYTNGDVLEARQLNHMETGIKENSDNIDKLSEEMVKNEAHKSLVERMASVETSHNNLSQKVDGVEKTLEESEISGIISYQFTTVGESDANVDVELSSEELVELNTTIASLQSLKKANTSIIAFLTDLHMAGWTAVKNKKAVSGYNKISASVKTDLLLFGGDYLENSATTTKEQALGLYSDLKDIVSYCNNKAPVAVIKGNHDDNTMHTDYVNGFVDAETFWGVFGNIEEDRTIRNAGNIEDCYGYYDIPNQKIRVFYLNTVDLPQKLIEASNTINYKGQWDTGISVKQLQFVADHLKFNTPGWQVMVFSHHPIMRSIAIENNCGVQVDRGGSALLELLDKFNTGNKTGNISVTGKDFEGVVTYDFSNNEDCKLIACVNGHTHRDSVDKYNSFFCISTRAVYGHPSYDGHISSSAYFVVDRNNYNLHLIYNGDGEENVFNYDTLPEGGNTPTEPVYEQIESPFAWQIGQASDTTGEITADSQNMRIVSTEIVGFTTEATIDMSAYNAMYVYYLFDTDGNFIENSAIWIPTGTAFTLPVDKTVRFKIRHNNYETWSNDNISTFTDAVKVYVEEGGSSYIVESETVVNVASPFEFQISAVNDTTGNISGDPQNMRISSLDIIAFTKDVTIDLSSYNAMYVAYWYDENGDYLGRNNTSWVSTSTKLEVPANKGVRFKLRNNNYELWTESMITQLSDSIRITGMNGVKSYIIADESLNAITFRIGAGASSDNEAYKNDSRMMATQSFGVKAYSSYDYLWGEAAYPLSIPSDATKINVTCPNFIYGLIFAKYENGKYVTVNDVGWQTLNGGEHSFEVGEYEYVHVSFKNSSNTTIPTDTDTSEFCVEFE